MPWKNGGGVTTEIAVFPDSAGVEAFDWRISMATVSSDGPFSLFDGIDRTLSILEGDGIALSVDGAEPVALTAKTPPFAFAADLPTTSTLLGGPVLDLNVMTRRGRFVHDVQRLSLSGRSGLALSPGSRLLICVEGEIILDDAAGTVLVRYDAAVFSDGEALPALSSAKPALAYLVTLHKV
ncbi:MAG: HutD family protein [Allorhizobium sp.]